MEKIVGCCCGCGWWLLCMTHELSTTTEGSVKPRSAGATANVDRGGSMMVVVVVVVVACGIFPFQLFLLLNSQVIHQR